MSEQVTFDQETKKFHKKTKKQYCLRLILANIAFFIAIGMLVYLVQTGPNLLHLKGVDDFYKTSKEKFTNKIFLVLKLSKRSSAISKPNSFFCKLMKEWYEAVIYLKSIDPKTINLRQNTFSNHENILVHTVMTWCHIDRIKFDRWKFSPMFNPL